MITDLKTAKPTRFTEAIVSSKAHAAPDNSVIVRYYDGLVKAQQLVERETSSAPKLMFEPDRCLPPLEDDFVEFFKPAQLSLQELDEYRGVRLNFFNLALDPATNTTKTLPSLVMISWAVQHIRRTGERIVLLVTTSGNKGTALRSAVERAITLGLVTPEQLRIITLVPRSSIHKLRASALTRDSTLAQLNPLVLYEGADSTKLKTLGREFQESHFDIYCQRLNTNIWYSLNLDNYRIADSARAYYEYEYLAAHNKLEQGDRVRMHAHAVSSAYGFLGYHLGRSVLVNEGVTDWASSPGYFMVQHLQTPDLVLHHYNGSFDRKNVPTYQLDPDSKFYVQQSEPHFPQKTFAPTEDLDPTFYTKSPPTAPAIANMARQCGGGGIVVSLAECLECYPRIRSMLANVGVMLPQDPRRITEWALVMVLTGVLQAIDRKIIPEEAEITIQSSGFYQADIDYEPLSASSLLRTDDLNAEDTLEKLIDLR